jgi:hypothetical protein
VNRRLAQIYVRRERLVAKAAAQRDEVALLLAPLAGPLAVADRGVAAAVYVRAHPEIVPLGAAGLRRVARLPLGRRRFGARAPLNLQRTQS